MVVTRPVTKATDLVELFQRVELRRLSKMELRNVIHGLEEANFAAERRVDELEQALLVSQAREHYLASWLRTLKKDDAK